jgi:hypothetical protein
VAESSSLFAGPEKTMHASTSSVDDGVVARETFSYRQKTAEVASLP